MEDVYNMMEKDRERSTVEDVYNMVGKDGERSTVEDVGNMLGKEWAGADAVDRRSCKNFM